MVDASVSRVVRNYLRKLGDAGINANHAVVFGSQARGTARPDSDIDVLVLSDDFRNLTWDQEGLAWEVAKRLDWRLEPVLCDEDTYANNDWHPLLDVAKREGIEIEV